MQFLFCLIVFGDILYTVLHSLKQTERSMIKHYQLLHSTHPKVLIYARMRTGSSFLLSIFKSHPDVFTIFEPLRYVPEHSHNDLLSTLYRCNFYSMLNNISTFLKTSMSQLDIHYNKYRTLCHQQISCENISALQTQCEIKSAIIIKTIRSTSLAKILSSLDETVKIIFLLRDQRAVANSYLHNKKKQSIVESLTDKFHKKCQSYMNDLNFLKDLLNNNKAYVKLRFKLLRFEDLASSPMKIAKELFSFSNIPFHKDVQSWIKINTNISRKGYYTTSRISKNIIDNWVHEMNKTHIFKVQNVCREFLKRTGYQLLSKNISNFNPWEIKEQNLFELI